MTPSAVQVTPDPMAIAFAADGVAVVDAVIPPDTVEALRQALPGNVAGRRNLLREIPSVAAFARSAPVLALLERLTGLRPSPVRGLFFDKNPSANWGVPWHQDLAIAVRERREVPGFGPWSVKAGVVHAHAPAAILERMVTLRVHLDDCDADNGALRVIPGSHRLGRLRESEVESASQAPERVCVVGQGGVVAMRPLLLHASSPALRARHRRVLHVEFSPDLLPGGLEWEGAPG